MSNPLRCLALDLGAESGRAMLGRFDGQRLQLSEIHRFPNVPVHLPDGLHWDILRLWGEVKQAVALAIRDKHDLASIGIDTWAVDYGLLDGSGALLSNPYHYRDSRTDGMLEEAFRRVPREEIFGQTGIQFLQLNSLYQLLSMVVDRAPVLDITETFLTIPDLLNYWLTGQAVCEFSNATTTQCYNPRDGDWAQGMLQRLGIPPHIFPPIAPPGSDLGQLLPHVADEVGLHFEKGPRVIAPACHDTGSAVAAIPATAPDFAWISSGTWSVVGAEVPEPVINEQSLAYNFTNEGGVFGTFRFSRNVMGLWLVQECRRDWARTGKDHSYDQLTQMAAQAPAFGPLVSLSDSRFLPPGDMPKRIQEFCRETGQAVPETRGEIIRCALESLALEYRWVAERLDEIVGRWLPTVHIFGGGSQNRLLNQFAADALARTVITGPVEATAIGNVLVQALALGHIATLAEGRALVRSSFKVETYEPTGTAAWDEAYQRYLKLKEGV